MRDTGKGFSDAPAFMPPTSDRNHMEVLIERQIAPVSEDVTALLAVVRPILEALLFGLRQDIVQEAGGYESLKLKMLPRLYLRGDGDIGLCFEYAVHQAIRDESPAVLERVSDAMKLCKIPGGELESLLFAVEKSGKLDLVNSVKEALTESSQLLYGTRGRPVKLRRHIDQVASAFHRPRARRALPQSISGLWKADLFLGHVEFDRWVGTSVKVNERSLRAVKGLRIGVIPSRHGASDRVRKDEQKNLVVCPLPYDGSFTELFYAGWRIVQQFLSAQARVPSEGALPLSAERQVAKELAVRREFPVTEVIDVLTAQAQPGLLESDQMTARVDVAREGPSIADSILAPVPLGED